MYRQKINRNENCWCGSLKKYKRCHYSFDEKLRHFSAQGYPIPDRSLIKTPAQIEGIKKSCKLTSYLLTELNQKIKPGVTTNELDQWVYNETVKHNAKPAPLGYKGFPKSICTSINEVVCHGIPEDRQLIDGDILNVDITCILDGYYGDSCRMYEVGTISAEAKRLIDVTKNCLDQSIDALKPFEPLNIVGDTIEACAHEAGFSVIEMFGGHGVGNEFHEDPFIFHYSRKDKQMICVPGMVFTIEPMINAGTKYCQILDDGWTAVTKDRKLTAQWEHTVLVTSSGIEVLTL